jgi:FOG: TPR repeat, SEL1 subfamily
MKYLIHEGDGIDGSKETVLKLVDGRLLCRSKEPYQEIKIYIDMILNRISSFWNDITDENSLQNRIINDDNRLLLIDPDDYTSEDRAFLRKCGGELKLGYDWDGLPEMSYNGSWPEKYNGKYYIDAGDTMEMKCFDDSGILFQITTYNMCNVAKFRTLSNEDTLKESRSLEIQISHDIYDQVIALGYNAVFDERFGDINIISSNSKYPIIRYNDRYYRCLTQLHLAHTLSVDGDILSAKVIKVYKPLFPDSESNGRSLQNSLIQPTLNDYTVALQKGEESFTTLKDLEPVLTEDGKLVVNIFGSTTDFKMRDKKTKRIFALKTFTKNISRLTEKYKAIESYFSTTGSPEFIVIPKVYEDELSLTIETGIAKLPVVVTPWPTGSSLFSCVMKNSGDSVVMNMLTHRLSKVFVNLRNKNFVHGNLNPRNIYYDPLSYEFKLYDYDNMVIPDCKIGFLKKRDENYIFPNKTKLTIHDADDFAITTILLSLKAISINSNLLNRDNNNALVFTKADFINIAKSKITNSLPTLLENSDFRSLYSLFAVVLDKGILQTEMVEKLNVSNPYVDEALSMYQEGVVLKEMGNYEEAAKKFNRASFMGNFSSNCELGYLTINSLIPVSPRLRSAIAISYYKRNIPQMDKVASFNIGVIYYKHHNFTESIKYFKMSANWGNAIAQCNLAYIYENGIGVEEDPVTSEQYMLCASESYNVIARSIVLNAVFGLEPYMKIIETYNDDYQWNQ